MIGESGAKIIPGNCTPKKEGREVGLPASRARYVDVIPFERCPTRIDVDCSEPLRFGVFDDAFEMDV